MVEVIATICREQGHEVSPFTDGKKAIAKLAQTAPDLVISDLKLRDMDGIEILRSVKEIFPQTPVILITAHASVETAIEAMREGAYDYIIKPFKIDELQITIQRAIEYQVTVSENIHLKKELKKRYSFDNIIGNSQRMQETYHLIAKVANTDSTILIQGESGTGKELVARALHFNSGRQNQPFVTINCSALPENLLESELFGHKKGAFTGAVQDKAGLFETAQKGTIFLDEINSMAQPLQTKLLRVLQERQIRRVGDNEMVPINVRVLAATNEPLLSKIEAGEFREDLYYRLAVIPIEISPLRERLEDIPLLVNHFLQKNATQYASELKKISSEALEILANHDWPGNVRELENAIERACALCDDGHIHSRDLPPRILQQGKNPANSERAKLPLGIPLQDFINDQERQFIEETLKSHEGSEKEAAKALGISVATLQKKIVPAQK